MADREEAAAVRGAGVAFTADAHGDSAPWPSAAHAQLWGTVPGTPVPRLRTEGETAAQWKPRMWAWLFLDALVLSQFLPD